MTLFSPANWQCGLAICLLLIIAFPTHATTITPTISIEPVATDNASTTYNIILTQNSEALNVVEFAIEFDPINTTIASSSIESALCRPELTVANTIDTEAGEWYVACGNYMPFSGTSTVLATFTATHITESASWLQFGSSASLYRHDGFGTMIIPTTLSWRYIDELLAS